MKRAALVAATLVAFALPSRARAAPGDQCARAAEEGQRLRDEGKLRAARPQFLECSREGCPLFIRNDCIRWLAEADAALPTVSIRARDSRGQDITGARLEIDGAIVAEDLRGQSVQLDPGAHAIVLTAKGGDRVAQNVVVVRGERDRILTFTFERPLATDGTPIAGATSPAPAPKEAARTDDGPSYALPITFTTIAVVGIAAFTVLDLHAYGRYSDLEDGCGKTKSCTEDDVSGLRGEFTGAAIALGVGIVAAGLATYFFVTTPRKSARAAAASAPLRITF